MARFSSDNLQFDQLFVIRSSMISKKPSRWLEVWNSFTACSMAIWDAGQCPSRPFLEQNTQTLENTEHTVVQKYRPDAAYVLPLASTDLCCSNNTLRSCAGALLCTIHAMRFMAEDTPEKQHCTRPAGHAKIMQSAHRHSGAILRQDRWSALVRRKSHHPARVLP